MTATETCLLYNDDSDIEGRRTNFSLRRNLPRGVYYIDVLSWDGAIGDYTLHTDAVTDPGSTVRHGNHFES